ncbi:14622_t:CDS:2 [Rhizophagus irregularis]|nr:14622_t:CDS:2 [Rhizophagus irregularis]
MTDDSFNKNNNKNKNNTSIFSFESNITNYDSSSFKFNFTTSPSLIVNNIQFFDNFITKFFKELIQELYFILLNMEYEYGDYNFNNVKLIINTLLLDYDLDSKNVLEIMTNNSQNIFCYTSLIGIFYQCGIGCEVDKIKALNIFFNAVKNNQKAILDQFSFDQKNETICFRNDSFYNNDIKELNEIITQYFYSLLIYQDIIFHRKDNYKLHIKNAEKGDDISQYYVGKFYCIKQDYNKAIEWYSKSSEGGNIKAMFELGVCYEHGYYEVIKDEKKAFKFYLKSAEGGYKWALYRVGNCYHFGECKYYINNSINKNGSKAFKWYMRLANVNILKAIYIVAKCYRDGIGTDKNLKEAMEWIRKYEFSRFGKNPQINLDHFLNGLDIDISSLPLYTF